MIFLIHISSEGRAREPYPFPVSKAFQILRILSRLHVGREVRDKSGPTSSVAVRHWGPLGLQREIQALLFRDRSRLGSIFQAARAPEACWAVLSQPRSSIHALRQNARRGPRYHRGISWSAHRLGFPSVHLWILQFAQQPVAPTRDSSGTLGVVSAFRVPARSFGSPG